MVTRKVLDSCDLVLDLANGRASLEQQFIIAVTLNADKALVRLAAPPEYCLKSLNKFGTVLGESWG